MAVAVLSKKKLKSRSSQRSPSSRALEQEDEDTAIIGLLEKEPWQPDQLLKRRSDKSTSDFKTYQNTALPSTSLGSTSTAGTAGAVTNIINKNVHHTGSRGDRNSDTGVGFQNGIPVIIKSPSSVINEVADTIAESDHVESITDMDGDYPIVIPPTKIRGIEEYLQQTHQEQQQQEIHMQKEKDKERGRGREKEREKARERTTTGDDEEEEEWTEIPPMELHLQYQLPAHLRSTNGNGHPNYRREQQYHTSYHPSLSLSSSPGPFLEQEERTTPSTSTHALASRNDTPEEKVMVTDEENVVESLQSLKNITMLALDGLLQQVVSDVTASDPVHNADETTLQARALIRRRSIPLFEFTGKEPEELTMTPTSTTPAAGGKEHCAGISMRHSFSTQRAISDSLIASLATSSLERLDELARKVDQLAAVAADEQQYLAQNQHQQQQQQQTSNGTILSSSSSGKVGQILSEALEIPVQRQETVLVHGQQQRILDSTQVLESDEYQLACALAAMLACIYRILNHMQQQQQQHHEHVEEKLLHTPKRTESVDSGLDQASKLWQRLSSNSFAKNHLRPSMSLPESATAVSASKMTIMGNHLSFSPEGKVLAAGQETLSRNINSNPATNETNSFMKTINKQVRTLRSRRSQSTSHIEVNASRHAIKSLQGRVLGGLQIGGRKSKTMSSTISNHGSLYPENTAELENAKELENEWSELDNLMDEMARLWRFVESNEQQLDSEEETGLEAKNDTDDDNENNPFHDRHQVQPLPQQQQQQQQQQQSTVSSTTIYVPYTMGSKQGENFDQQTLEMSVEDDLPQYDADSPDYRFSEEPTDSLLPSKNSRQTNGLISRTSRGLRSITNNHSRGRGRGREGGGLVDDEKTRFDLNNVMSAIERLSMVAPRLDNQRVQLSLNQKKQMARTTIANTIQRLSRDRREFQIGSSSASASRSPTTAAAQKREAMEKHQDLDKLINQIVESANKASNSSFSTAQRAEFSPKQQWKLESARMGDRIERGARLRMSDQDSQSPEKVLLQDMTRLTNALYQQSASSRAFATQRFTLTEDKARNMAFQGIISKIERVSGRRMVNQDATSPSVKSKPASPSSICSNGCGSSSNSSERAKELQEMLNQVMESGGGPTRKSAMASQRAQFGPKH